MPLLDQNSFYDPQNIGLLTLGAGLLAGGGPSRQPTNFGGILGTAGGQALSAMQAAHLQQSNLEQQRLQMQLLQQNYQRQNMLMDLAAQYLPGAQGTGATGAGGGGTSQPASPLAPQPGPWAGGLNQPPPEMQQSVLGPNPQPQSQQRNLANLGLVFGIGKMDPAAILAANEQLYPKGIPQREGAPVVDPYTGREISPAPLKTSEGLAQRRNPVTGQLEYYKPPGAELIPQQAADIETAKLTAKAPLTMAPPRQTPSGQMTYQTEAQAIAEANQPRGVVGARPPGAVGYGPTIEGQAYSGKLATAREDYTKAAMAAHEALPSLQLMKDALINGLKTNNLTEFTNNWGGWMNALGIDPAQFGINDPTNTQEFQKGATKLIAEMTRGLGSREPFQAIQFVQKGNPGLGNTVEANVKLTSIVEGTKFWEIARDQEAQKWAQKYGTTDGFIQDFSAKNPVSKYWQKSYDELKKQIPKTTAPVTPMKRNTGSVPLQPPLRKNQDGSYDYVPKP
jgi:hypothetical protein